MNRDLIIKLANQAPLVKPYHDPRFPHSVYYRFLRLLAEIVQPKLSVELGVCGGGGSLHLSLGWPDGIVVGIDYSDEYPNNIQHIKDTFPNFEYWKMDVLDAVHHFAGNRRVRKAEGTVPPKFGNTGIDILFIDTVHTYEKTLEEFNAYHHLLSDGAVVILDDLFRVGMQEAWDILPGEKIRLDDLHHGGSPTDGGFGVILM